MGPVILSYPLDGFHTSGDKDLPSYVQSGQDLIGRTWGSRTTFADKRSPGAIAAPFGLNAAVDFTADGAIEIMSIALCPDGFTLADVAAGKLDYVFVFLGQNIVKAGLVANLIVRLGWECNVKGWAWSALPDAPLFIAAFRRAVGLIRQADPRIQIDFNVSLGTGNIAWFEKAYPGKDYCTTISCDVYNDWIKIRDLLNAVNGLNPIAAFAHQEGKPLLVPEWSVSLDTHGFGDNVEFVDVMLDWMKGVPGLAIANWYNWRMGCIWGPGLNAPLARQRYIDRLRPQPFGILGALGAIATTSTAQIAA